MKTWTSCKNVFDTSPEKFGELRSSNDLLTNPEKLRKRIAEDGYLLLRGLLNVDKVRAARCEEMRFVREQQVWTPISAQLAHEHGWSVIGTKWIDIDKGDAERPNYRSRLVAQEFNTSVG